jgi:hypothetical protein
MLSPDHIGGATIGCRNERGIHPQGGRTAAAVPQATGDGAQIDPGGKQLRGGVVAESVQARRHADLLGKPAEPLRYRIRQHRRTTAGLRAKHIGADGQAHTGEPGDLLAALPVGSEQIHGRVIEGDAAGLVGLSVLLLALFAALDVAALDQQLARIQVDVEPAQRAQLTAAHPGGHRQPQQRPESRPYHPQTCGKVERFHQTLKRWLAKQPKAPTVAELQAQLDHFAGYYNHHRPHRALGRRTPAVAFAARPKATPAPPGFAVPAHYRVRTDKVDRTGVITLRHNSRLHHIGLGRRHAGVRVCLLVADLEVRVLAEDGQLLRALTLDPGRDYQPQQRPARGTMSRDITLVPPAGFEPATHGLGKGNPNSLRTTVMHLPCSSHLSSL